MPKSNNTRRTTIGKELNIYQLYLINCGTMEDIESWEVRILGKP